MAHDRSDWRDMGNTSIGRGRRDEQLIARALFIASVWLGDRPDLFPGEAADVVDLIRRRYPEEFDRMREGASMWARARDLGFTAPPGELADTRDVYEFLAARGVTDLPPLREPNIIPLDAWRVGARPRTDEPPAA